MNVMKSRRIPAKSSGECFGHSQVHTANLAALLKKNGDIRPIGVGETWRRLVSKCLSKVSQRHASEHLVPLQVGVGLPLGTEAAVRTLRSWFHRHAEEGDKVVLNIDFENAFNCVDRQTIIQQCRLHFPELSPWVEWCYMEPSLLQFGARTIKSESGVQQGDPLGPLLLPWRSSCFSPASRKTIHKPKKTIVKPVISTTIQPKPLYNQ